MKKWLIGSINKQKPKAFCNVSVNFFKLLKGWPVSIVYEQFPQNCGDIPSIMHKKTDEFVYIISGSANVYLNSASYKVRTGDYMVIPHGVVHRFVTGNKPMVALSVFSPPMNLSKLDVKIVFNKKSAKPKRKK